MILASGFASLIQTYGLGIIVVMTIGIILAIVGLIELILKIKGFLNTYYTTRKSKETEQEGVEARLAQLEKSDKAQDKKLDDLKSLVEGTQRAIDALERNQNEVNRVQAQSAMYKLSNELIKKNWATEQEHKTLSDLTRVFLVSGDKDFVIPPLVHRALQLQVLTDEEIEKMNIKSVD